MKQKCFLGLLPALFLLALPAAIHAQTNTLRLGSGAGTIGGTARVDILLDTESSVQGLQVVVEWDASQLECVAVEPGAVLDQDNISGPGADTVVSECASGHAILGVLMDSNPNDNGEVAEKLGPGTGIVLGTLVLRCLLVEPETTISFVDGTHDLGGPLLDNLVVIGGLSVDQTQDLGLEGGSVECREPSDELTIQDGGNVCEEAANAVDIAVVMTNGSDVEGFVTAVCHDDAVLSLNSITLGSAAAAADFFESEIEAGGGTFGVVMDLVSPMNTPPPIGAGVDQPIAVYQYRCDISPSDCTGVETPLSFCDKVLGSPVKDNLLVIGGLSSSVADGLTLNDGTFTCRLATTPEDCSNGVDDDGDGRADCADTDCAGEARCQPEDNCADGVDNDEDGFTDCDDADCRRLDPVTCPTVNFTIECGVPGVDEDGVDTFLPALAVVGDPAPVPLWLRSPTADALGADASPGEGFVCVQGFSLGLEYECDEVNASASFDISGTILEALGTEFVGVQADNSADDGDGCSLVLGVLIDALPPFDGACIPGLPDPQLLGSLEFTVLNDADCGSGVSIVAVDGVNGEGSVPVANLLSVNNKPFSLFALDGVRPCSLVRGSAPAFYRGDCNFTGGNTPIMAGGIPAVEISDAAAVISYLFQTSIFKFDPPCLDACDANDDGRVDLADAMKILNYLFVPGSAFPPAPGPGIDGDANATDPGVDPTEDPLDCAGAHQCGSPGD
jgi:hypothetical protein